MKTIYFIIEFYNVMSGYSEQFNLAGNHFDNNDFSKAIELYSQILKSDSLNFRALSNRGLAYLKLGKLKLAKKDLESAININKIDPFPRLTSVSVNIEEGELGLAMQELDYIITNTENSNKYKLDKLMATFMRAKLNKELGNYHEAILDYSEIINSYGEMNNDLPFIYFNRAIAKMSLDDNLGGMIDMNEVISLEMNKGFGFIGRAFSNYRMGLIGQAIEDCFIGIKKGDISYGFQCLGDFYFKWKEDVMAAICCIRIAIEHYGVTSAKSDHFVRTEPSISELYFKAGNYYLMWSVKGALNGDFVSRINQIGNFNLTGYVDKESFSNRERISEGYYAKAFVDLMPVIGTHKEREPEFSVWLFIGQEKHLFSPLLKEEFYFGDAQHFSDKSDCIVLSEASNIQIPVFISYHNVRIACFSKFSDDSDICKAMNMWDRYGNAHSGIAYKFRVTKKWLLRNQIYFHEISYKGNKKTEKRDSPESVINKGLFNKQADYSFEKEWRMVKFGIFEDKQPIFVSWMADGVKSVFIESIHLGAFMPAVIKEQIKKLGNERNIPIFELQMSGSGNLVEFVVN